MNRPTHITIRRASFLGAMDRLVEVNKLMPNATSNLIQTMKHYSGDTRYVTLSLVDMQLISKEL